jgi:hypothetical protein
VSGQHKYLGFLLGLIGLGLLLPHAPAGEQRGAPAAPGHTAAPSERDAAMTPAQPGRPVSGALLAARDLPALVPGAAAWQETGTFGGPGGISDIPCQPESVRDLGAQWEDFRTFKEPPGPGLHYAFLGAQIVARFPSSAKASRAATRFGTWIDDCVSDGPQRDATVRRTAAASWQVTSAGPDRGVFTAGEYAVAWSGRFVSVLYLSSEDVHGQVSLIRFDAAAARARALLVAEAAQPVGVEPSRPT